MRSPRCVQLWHAAPLRATSHELRRGARRRTSDNVFYKEAFHTSDLEQPGARTQLLLPQSVRLRGSGGATLVRWRQYESRDGAIGGVMSDAVQRLGDGIGEEGEAIWCWVNEYGLFCCVAGKNISISSKGTASLGK